MSNKKVEMMHLSPIWLMSQSGFKDKEHIQSVEGHFQQMHSHFHHCQDWGAWDGAQVLEKNPTFHLKKKL